MKKAAFIKKALSLLLALSLLFVFVACSNGGDVPSTTGTEPSSEAETSGDKEEAFVKPENYAAVLTVTINPQFRLYLDADGIVLAVESVNKDAEEVKEDISFENDNYEVVIEKIVTKSEEKGYVKNDAVINVEITETKDTAVNTVEILDKITITVNNAATKLELKVEVKTEDKSAIAEQPTEGAAGSTEPPTEQQKTDPTEVSATSPTQCSHVYKDATCTAPKTCSKCGATESNAVGHSWKEATCAAPKTCTKCGATEGAAAGHNWSDATCTSAKTCKICKATEGKAAGHNYKDATCTAPKTCSKCGVAEGDPLLHNYQSGLCVSCGYRQLNVGKWRLVSPSDMLVVTLDQDSAIAHRRQLFDVKTAEKVWPDDAPQIEYQGVTYACWYEEGCRCSYEIAGDTLTVYLPDDEANKIILKRVSANQMMVIEATGEAKGWLLLQPGYIFTYQS